jgi:hypothetical protein
MKTSTIVVRPELFRWECRSEQPPMLLATYDSNGTAHIKVRDRYWHVRGEVRSICPRCGTEHMLDMSTE